MNIIIKRHPYALGILAVFGIFVGVATVDYTVLKRESQGVIYARPPMAAPCRDPKVGEELRIWIDKRTTEKEGTRTCRLIPISGDDSPRKAWKKAMKL